MLIWRDGHAILFEEHMVKALKRSHDMMEIGKIAEAITDICMVSKSRPISENLIETWKLDRFYPVKKAWYPDDRYC